jgi:transketolase
MRGAVRLAALMGVPVTYVWSHDSIGLGEDGPTHQPVEHLWALRAIPGLSVVRPADANETAAAWQVLLERDRGPVALALTRQNVPVLDPADVSADQVRRGAYVLSDHGGQPDVILIATGSEVQLAMAAATTLRGEGLRPRVVSAPCLEWFAGQDDAYRESVLPPAVRARVSVEAGVTQGWSAFVGDAGRSVGLDHFGASADHYRLFSEFGITADAVVAAARDSLKRAAGPAR